MGWLANKQGGCRDSCTFTQIMPRKEVSKPDEHESTSSYLMWHKGASHSHWPTAACLAIKGGMGVSELAQAQQGLHNRLLKGFISLLQSVAMPVDASRAAVLRLDVLHSHPGLLEGSKGLDGSHMGAGNACLVRCSFMVQSWLLQVTQK